LKTRVIISDDQNIVREGLKALLESTGNIDVIAESDNGRETVSLARELEPDVVVMDVSMPGMNGIEATRKMNRLAPGVRVLALSNHSENLYVKGMLEAGARGYLVKTVAIDELLSAVDTIMKGRIYVSPQIGEILVEIYKDQVSGNTDIEVEVLSVREREVLQLVAEGYSSARIALSLSLSERTIEAHRRRIVKKLGISTIAELTKYAIRAGLTTLD
jgi:DNA-binding NarL/FixJ family response regulator